MRCKEALEVMEMHVKTNQVSYDISLVSPEGQEVLLKDVFSHPPRDLTTVSTATEVEFFYEGKV